MNQNRLDRLTALAFAALACGAHGCLAERGNATSGPTTPSGDTPSAVAVNENTTEGMTTPFTPTLQCIAPTAGHAMRLLTRFEYDNTLRDLLGETRRLAAQFPPENRVLGLDDNAEAHVVNPALVRAYQDTAEDIATHAVNERLSSVLPCAPATADCGHRFLTQFLPRAFRRPVTTEESAVFVTLFDTASRAY